MIVAEHFGHVLFSAAWTFSRLIFSGLGISAALFNRNAHNPAFWREGSWWAFLRERSGVVITGITMRNHAFLWR
jgi:hypothetical protein